MTPPRLDARLSAAAGYVRQGAYMADVGCDHAHLPVFLCMTGRVDRAVAADVADGPCERARACVERYGLCDRIRVVRTDGLAGLEREGLTDVAVCGMGGELIVRIIDRAPFLRDPAVRLILSPNTHAHDLRRWLAAHGFSVTEQTLTEEGKKFYVCLCAAYDGRPRTLSPFEAAYGDLTATRTDPQTLAAFFARERTRLSRVVRALTRAGRPHEAEDALLTEMEKYL